MVLYEADCFTLGALFDSLPSALPVNPPGSLLPPQIDIIFANEEGAWPAFNKAMHASFGDKTVGLRIQERGSGLTQTMAVIRWALSGINAAGDDASGPLIKLWIDALVTAAKAASACINDQYSRPKRNNQGNGRQKLCDLTTTAHPKAMQVPIKKVKPSYIYVDEDDNEVPEVNVKKNKTLAMIVNPVIEVETDPEYERSYRGSSSADTDGEMEIEGDELIPNAEVASLLQRKTEVESKKKSKQRKAAHDAAEIIDNGLPGKKRKRKNKKNEAQDQGTFPPVTKKARIQTIDGEQEAESGAQGADTKKRPAIYYFYEVVLENSDGQVGLPGDKHYCCYHGKHKILTVTKKMKGSQTGLIGHLQTYFPAMFRLYLEFKAHSDKPPTVQELQLAANVIPMDSKAAMVYIQALEAKTGPLINAFQRAAARAESVWDQKEFEQLLNEWIVACDQPFDEVEKPELQAVLQYTHHRATMLHIPSASTIKRRVMKLGETTQEDLQKMIADLDGNVSLSLDAWSSENGYAFMGIVMHYVSRDWLLEEILVDFQELIGEHSGCNMAATVYKTINALGLKGRIQLIVSDNAYNNDTMMLELQRMLAAENIEFDEVNARGRCLPHIIHLAAIKLLVGIGGLSATDLKDGIQLNYQESVALSTSRSEDENTVLYEDEDDSNPYKNSLLLNPFEKLRRIIRSIRASPQHRKQWLEEIELAHRDETGVKEVPKMLILDVRTRWSSAHQMCRRALDYQNEIDSYVARPNHKELRPYELSSEDWDVITLVTGWLRAFRDATTQMSSTKHSTLSSTHAVFKGLQDHIANEFAALPTTASSSVREALLTSHRKLSDYFLKIDQSPYPVWASLLDPRINYKGLIADYQDEPELLKELETSKSNLETHYSLHYAGKVVIPKPIQPMPILSLSRSSSGVLPPSPKKFNFTSRYSSKQSDSDRNELEEYFKQSPEVWEGCDPVKWWGARQAQFPNLCKFARDIMTIPGCAVAVERIFSAGRDTISLRRAGLKPDTIRTLMLVKQRLRLARIAVQEVLGDE